MMNRSHFLMSVNPSRWRQLISAGTKGHCHERQSFLPLCILQTLRPHSQVVKAACCSKHSSWFRINFDQSYCSNKSTLCTSHSSDEIYNGNYSLFPKSPGKHFILNTSKSLSHRNTYCFKTLVRCLHMTSSDQGIARKRTADSSSAKASKKADISQKRKEEQADRTRSAAVWPEGVGQEAWTLETEEELQRLSMEVLRQAGEREVMVRAVPLAQVEPLVLGLYQSGGWSTPDILALLSSSPSLLLLPLRRALLPTVHRLLELGFSGQQVRVIVEDLPVILQTPASQTSQAINALRALGFGEDTLFPVVSHNPSLLLSSPTALQERVISLRQLFKSADVVTLVLKCPRLLTDPWQDVQCKFDYAFHEMKASQRQMVHAALFNYSVTHIKQRHTFLVRAGMYSTTKRKEGERNPNASLDQIVTTSEKEFCRRFGGLSVAEYRAFCRLYDKERQMLKSMGEEHSYSDDDGGESLESK